MAGRMLMVVDAAAMARWLPRHFADRGWSVEVARNESDVLARLDPEHPGGAPDVAVIDIILGETETFAVVQDIRREWPGAFLVVTSARYGLVARMKALAAGADAYITKPFALADLDRLVEGKGAA